MNKLLLTGILTSLFILSTNAEDYLQLPGHFGGFGSDAGIAVADDFIFYRNMAIRSISWWGGYFSPGRSDNFTVRIFADSGGQPGIVLRDLTGAKIHRNSTEKFVNGRGRSGLYHEYHYKLILPISFQAEAGQKYWLRRRQ